MSALVIMLKGLGLKILSLTTSYMFSLSTQYTTVAAANSQFRPSLPAAAAGRLAAQLAPTPCRRVSTRSGPYSSAMAAARPPRRPGASPTVRCSRVRIFRARTNTPGWDGVAGNVDGYFYNRRRPLWPPRHPANCYITQPASDASEHDNSRPPSSSIHLNVR